MPFAESEAKERFCPFSAHLDGEMSRCVTGNCMAWEVLAAKGTEVTLENPKAEEMLKRYPEVYSRSPKETDGANATTLTRLQDIGDCMMKQQRVTT